MRSFVPQTSARSLDGKMVRGVLVLLLVLAVLGLSLDVFWHHHDDGAALRCAVCALHGATMAASPVPELAPLVSTPLSIPELAVEPGSHPLDQHPSRAPPLDLLS